MNKMRKRGEEDRGFTMIELLVVVVIIGILVAIAVPVYLNYRKGAANKSAASDVRGSVTAIEQYYTENSNVYPASQATMLGQGVSMVFTGAAGNQTVTVSPGNQLAYASYSTAAPVNAAFKVCGWSADAKTTYYYNSAKGGSVAKSGAADPTACAALTTE
jgi:type IV pilus assembly protein PilA